MNGFFGIMNIEPYNLTDEKRLPHADLGRKGTLL